MSWLRGNGESHTQPAFGDSMMRVEALSCDEGLGGGTANDFPLIVRVLRALSNHAEH